MAPLNIRALWQKADQCRGCLSHLKQTTGRRRAAEDEDPLQISNPFIADEAKILSSKSYRCLGDKTQVFTGAHSSLIRTRLTHVGEVAACAVITADMLGLNVELARAAAWGHDIGHVPFGHQGEAWMARTMGRPFCHEVMAPIVAQKIERRGRGLNLCHETLEAMMRHSGNLAVPTMTQESWVLRWADKFAYVFADYNDIVIRMRYPISQTLRDLAEWFGPNQRARTTTAIAGLVIESQKLGRVSFVQSEVAENFGRFLGLMYELYPRVTQQNVSEKMGAAYECLTRLKVGDPYLLLARMTDEDVIFLASRPMLDLVAFNQTTVAEIVPYLDEIGSVDLCDPGLDW